MRHRRARRVVFVAGLAALALAGCGNDTTRMAEPKPPIVIGALFSTSGRGVTQGPQQIKGARLAVAELNRRGGVGGAPLRLVVANDATNPNHAAAQTRTLIQRSHALALIGPTLSIIAIAVDPVANQLRTPVVAVSNTADGIVGRCPYACQWIWRASLGEATTVPANVRSYVLAAHPSTAALLYTYPDILGSGQADLAGATFRRNGVRVTSNLAVPVETKSLPGFVEEALASHPDVLFVGSSNSKELARIIRIARSRHFQGAILGGNLFNSRTTIGLAGAAGAGARSAAAWSRDNAFPANASFITAYQQAYRQQPDQFAAQAYAGILILAQAIERARLPGSHLPLAEQRQRLQQSLGDVALTTPLGPFHFTRDHDVHQIVWINAMNGRGGTRLVGFCNPLCGGSGQ